MFFLFSGVKDAAKEWVFTFGDLLGLLRDCGALEEHGIDYVSQGTDAPVFNSTHRGVEIALKVVFEGIISLKCDRLKFRDSVAAISPSEKTTAN